MPIHKRIQYNAPVILTYAVLALAALALDYFFGANLFLFSVFRAPFTDPLLYPRVFLHVLGHYNFAHFAGNIMLMLLLGPMLEERYGSKRLALMMAITALVTGALFLIVSPHAALLGGSGLVFMLILLSSFANIQQGRIPLTLVLVFALYIGQEIFAEVGSDTNISHITHIAGGLCGAVFGYVFNRKKP